MPLLKPRKSYIISETLQPHLPRLFERILNIDANDFCADEENPTGTDQHRPGRAGHALTKILIHQTAAVLSFDCTKRGSDIYVTTLPGSGHINPLNPTDTFHLYSRHRTKDQPGVHVAAYAESILNCS